MIVLISTSAFSMAGAAATGDYLQKFKDITKFVPGQDYNLMSTGKCDEGDVEISEVEENVVTIKIGEHLAIDAVGPGADKRLPGEDPDCEVHRESQVAENLIVEHKTETCKDGRKLDITLRIDVKPNGFTYTRSNGARRVVCKYVKSRG